MRRVVILRPEPGATATSAKARELGLDAVSVPLFEVEPVEWKAPEPSRFDALLVTSANALRHGGDELIKMRGLPVHAVGDVTAAAAREAGFDVASSGDAGVDRLLSSLEPDLKLLHLCGEDHKPTQAPRQRIERIVVYRSRAVAKPDLRLAQDAVVLIHSSRAAARFVEAIEGSGMRKSAIAIAAISPAAAQEVGAGWRTVEAASQPSDDALLALAAGLCNKPADR